MARIRVNKKLVPKGYNGITLYPFIFFKSEEHKENKQIVNHEKIHIEQQKELLVVFFFLIYVLHFVWNYFKFRNWDKAYRNIIFEKEAYGNERNLTYLKTRKRYAYWRK